MSRASPRRRAPRARLRGVALPIALILLFVLTGLVATQVRRGLTDERMAANTRESVMLDAAAQLVLRWCEARVIMFPRRTVTVPAEVGPTPAWRLPANWAPANVFTFLDADLPGINFNACLIEDATDELFGASSGQGGPAGERVRDPRWRKFRLTVQVRTPAADLPGGFRAMFMQSEMRLFL